MTAADVPADGQLSHALYRVARLHRALAGQLLRDIGLFPPQELVMMRLWNDGPQRQTDLVTALESDAATMTRTIRRLEHAGFVRRMPSPDDRRAVIIEATPASRGIRDDVERIWRSLDDALTEGATTGRRGELAKALTSMEQNLREAAKVTLRGEGSDR